MRTFTRCFCARICLAVLVLRYRWQPHWVLLTNDGFIDCSNPQRSQPESVILRWGAAMSNADNAWRWAGP
jgi:hypothetical protein